MLPPAPWKVGAVTGEGKRKRDNEDEAAPQAKQQKVAAVETMYLSPVEELPIWAEESEGSDF